MGKQEELKIKIFSSRGAECMIHDPYGRLVQQVLEVINIVGFQLSIGDFTELYYYSNDRNRVKIKEYLLSCNIVDWEDVKKMILAEIKSDEPDYSKIKFFVDIIEVYRSIEQNNYHRKQLEE